MFNKNFCSRLEKSIRKVCKNEKSINLHEPIFLNDEKKKLISCIDSTFVSTNGNYVQLFEKELSKICGSKYILATNTGTAALHIAYIVSKISSGDEVLIPSLNYVASSNVAKYVGAIPHFIDADEKNLGIDTEKLDSYLQKILIKKGKFFYNKKTSRKISAIVPTHLYGNMSNILELRDIAKKYNLDLIEDAAEAIGTFLNKKHAGTFGRMGILSFNGNKTITTGSGGAVIFNNKSDYLKGKLIANIGKLQKNEKTNFILLGYNYRINNLQAAVGLSQLKKLNTILNLKKKIHKNYKKELRTNLNVKLFQNNLDKNYNYWINILFLKDINSKEKKKLIQHLYKKKIKVRSAWDLMHTIKYFKDSPKMNLNTSNKIYREILNLPSSPKYGL